MSSNRITISSHAFILFAKAVFKLKDDKVTLQALLKYCNDSIGDKYDDDKFLLDFGSLTRTSDFKDFFYNKIATEIVQHKKTSLGFNIGNENSPFLQFYNRIAEKYPDHQAIKSGMHYFFETYLQDYFPVKATEKSAQQETSVVQRIKDVNYFGTEWYFYYHEYGTTRPYTTISRLVLFVSDVGDVTLFERPDHKNFELKSLVVTRGHNNISTINLESISKKKLALRIILPHELQEDSTLIGQYMDFESGDLIISGTFVLQRIKKGSTILFSKAVNYYMKKGIEEDKYTKKMDVTTHPGISRHVIEIDLAYFTGWERYIPKEVAQYLTHKWKNFTKTKPGIKKLADLSNFIEIQSSKYNESKYNAIIDYDIYLISPVSSLGKEQGLKHFEEINKTFFQSEIPLQNSKNFDFELYDSIDDLKKMELNRIYFHQRDIKARHPKMIDFANVETSLKARYEAMKSSRFVVLIMPEKKCSSALVEAGWAIQMEKPLFIFQSKEDALPRIISKGNNTSIHVAEKPVQVDKIPDYIELNYIDKFLF